MTPVKESHTGDPRIILGYAHGRYPQNSHYQRHSTTADSIPRHSHPAAQPLSWASQVLCCYSQWGMAGTWQLGPLSRRRSDGTRGCRGHRLRFRGVKRHAQVLLPVQQSQYGDGVLLTCSQSLEIVHDKMTDSAPVLESHSTMASYFVFLSLSFLIYRMGIIIKVIGLL